ncbi:ATP-binding protein [Streptomyces sp. NPDC017529]|uniref:ATP-binding protein n=1 Tax=Streptomyces sp. NPDC017529 TaxID=3365000 RepID=UPI00378BD25D
MRDELLASGVQDTVVDDAVLILSELLSNACRHARPVRALGTPGARDAAPDTVRAAWRIDAHGQLTISVTDGGGATRPLPATPSVTAKGGRGLAIIRSLAKEWGVRDAEDEVTVWALLTLHGLRDTFATRVDLPSDLSAELSAGIRAGLPNALAPDPASGLARPVRTPEPAGEPTLIGEPAFADFDEPV